MYWKRVEHLRRPEDGLTRAELEAARLGFRGCLRRKRFSPQFIERHAEDLFGQACFEFTRKLREGEEIDNPPGWLIECAWRRTKSKLEAEQSGPRMVSTEKTEPLSDSADADPEDLLMNADRWRKVRQAVGELSADERRLLAASYFEGLSVREAARRLRWHPSKAQRAHERAQDRLHELLGVESSDDLEIEVGLAAYVSVAAQPTAGVLERAVEGVAALRQQILEGGASLKQQTAASYVRVAEATPTLAGMRPGTSLAVLGTCAVTLVGGVTYCAEKGVTPAGMARSVFASTDGTEAPTSELPDPEAEGPVYTPAEPAEPEEQSPPEQTAPADEAPAPDSVPTASPVKDNFEPVHTDYMDESESENTESYEAPEEPAPVASSSEPAAVASGAPPQQFGRPGGSAP